MRKKGTMLLLIFLLVFQNLFFGMVGFANQDEFIDQPEQDESVIEHPGEGEGDSGLEDDESVIDPENGESTVTDEVYGPQISQSKEAPVQLTDVKLFYTEDNGSNWIEYTGNLRLGLGDDVKIVYSWELPEGPEGHGVTAGDHYMFSLPKEFKLFNDIVNEPLIFDGDDVGTFTVYEENNRVEMVFNDRVEHRSNVAGEIHIWNSISTAIVSEKSEVEIRFPLFDGNEKKITVKLKPNGGSTIGKSGLANNEFNGDKITWTVDINTGLEVIDNAVLRDAIEPGQELVPESVQIFSLDMDLNGNVTDENELDLDNFRHNLSSESLEITLGHINSAYRVTFTTNVTAEWDGSESEGKKTFSNTATLTGDGVNQPAPASVQIRRGEPLNKRNIDSEYDPITQTITWEIQFNYDSREMTNPVLVDTFRTDEGLDMVLDLDSFEVYKVELNENGEEASSTRVPKDSFTPTPTKVGDNDTGFRLQFNGTIDKPYKIRYQTEVTGKVFDDQGVRNRVFIEGTTTTRDAVQRINQGILTKENLGVNYDAKTTRWRVTFNGNNFVMENAVLEDMFPNDALTLLPDTVTVNGTPIRETGHTLGDYDGNLYDFDSPDPDLDFGKGFKINFTGNVTIQYTIEYVTAFDPDVVRVDGFKNEATIEWFEDSDRFEQTRGRTFNPNDYTNNNGFKRGNYDAKTKRITWDIGINYNLNEIEKAVVEDFLEKGQQLVEGSIKIYQMEIAPGGTPRHVGEALDPEVANIDIEEDLNGNPGFRITFNNRINSPYWITFETKLDGNNLINKTYHNKAIFHEGQGKSTDLSNSVDIRFGTEYVSKNRVGTENSRFIDWQIWINRSQAQIPAGTEIIDTPENQLLVEDSFTIYRTTVNPDGTVEKDPDPTKVLEEGTDYSLRIINNEDGSQRFNIIFTKEFHEPYVIEYQSFIFQATAGENAVSNSVQFRAEGIESGELVNTIPVTVRLSSGAGTGSGMVTDLTVLKVDGEDGTPLAGASFSLYYKSSERLVATITTGPNGEAVFENLLFTTYILEEDQAPDGYDADDTRREIILTKDNVDNQITVINWRTGTYPIGRLGDYVWLDSNRDGIQDPDENGVEGVDVDLYVKVNGEYQYLRSTKTDKEGKYIFDHLREGAYKVCFHLPEGYDFTTPFAGNDRAIDSDARPGEGPAEGDEEMGCSEEIKIGLGKWENLTIDAGLVELGRLGDYVWLDSNRDGIQDENENGIESVEVDLYKKVEDEYRYVGSTTTEEGGKYIFEGLKEGSYKVCFHLPESYGFTTPLTGDDRTLDSNARPGEGPANGNVRIGCSEEVEIGGDKWEDLTIDAGLVQLGRIGDYVWLDSNQNGIQDERETGVNSVEVVLYKKNGNDEFERIDNALTGDKEDKPGYYLFDDLEPGIYKVCFNLPRGYQFTRPFWGDDESLDSNAQPGDGPANGNRAIGCSKEVVIGPDTTWADLTIDAGLVKTTSGGGDHGDNGGSNPPTTPPTTPGKDTPKEEDPDKDGPDGPNRPGDGSNGGSNGGGDGVPGSPGAPGTGSGDTGNNGGTGTDGDDSDLANNPPTQGESDPKDKGRTLPQTGENISYLPLIGLLLCAVAVILWFRRSPKLS